MEPILPDNDMSIDARGGAAAGGGLRWLVWLVALLGVALLAWYWWTYRNSQDEAAPVTVAEAPVATAQGPITPPAEAEPAIENPVETAQADEPLPPVDDSDTLLAAAIVNLVGDKQWSALFFPERVVRRIVATVDNLPRHDAPVKMWPVRPTGSWLETAGGGDSLVIAPNNAGRYARYVKLVKAIDANKLAATYRRLYPLFQQSYRDLGYPKGYFNDRLIAALDDLMATPEPKAPLQLTQDKVLYQFADPDLDRRSAGQKIMLRIGTENARVVKTKLREFRAAVAKQEK
jgi:hypothetical protein